MRTLVRAGSETVLALSRSGPASEPHLPGVRAIAADIEDEGSLARAASIAADHGPFDLVIIASGLLHGEDLVPEKSWRHLSAEALNAYFAVNATGPALVARHFLPLLARREKAVFAALSARVGSLSDNRLGGWYGYRASKAALNMIVKCLAIELARTHGQAVCVALHPGTVATRLSEPFRRAVPADRLFGPDEAAERLLAVVAGLEPSQSGGCFAWDGSRIPP